MPWWGYVLFLIAVVIAIWGFLSMVSLRTRYFNRRTYRSADDLYPNYADLTRKQRREARQHAAEQPDGQDSSHLS